MRNQNNVHEVLDILQRAMLVYHKQRLAVSPLGIYRVLEDIRKLSAGESNARRLMQEGLSIHNIIDRIKADGYLLPQAVLDEMISEVCNPSRMGIPQDDPIKGAV